MPSSSSSSSSSSDPAPVEASSAGGNSAANVVELPPSSLLPPTALVTRSDQETHSLKASTALSSLSSLSPANNSSSAGCSSSASAALVGGIHNSKARLPYAPTVLIVTERLAGAFSLLFIDTLVSLFELVLNRIIKKVLLDMIFINTVVPILKILVMGIVDGGNEVLLTMRVLAEDVFLAAVVKAVRLLGTGEGMTENRAAIVARTGSE